MKTKTIEQTVTFDASAHDVYDAYVDAEQRAAFTGEKVIDIRSSSETAGIRRRPRM